MKKRALLLSLTVLLCISIIPVLSIEQPSYTAQDYVNVINANRSIDINAYGQVIVNDTFLVANNGTSSTNYFVIGIHNNYLNNLYYISAQINNINLQLSEALIINENISAYAVLFNEDLNPGNTINLSIIMVFGSIVNPVSTGSYSVTMFRYPLVYYNITDLSAEINSVGTITSPSSSTYIASNITNYNYSEFQIKFTYSSLPLVKYNVFKRTISYDPLLGLKVVEIHNITVENKATATSISTFNTSIFLESTNINVYDYSGKLPFTELDLNYSKSIVLTFRYGLQQNYKYIFFIEYFLPIQDFSKNDTSIPTLSISTLTPYWTTENYSQKVILPQFSSFLTITPPDGFSLNHPASNIIEFNAFNTTSFSNNNIEAEYTISLLDIIGRPLLFMAIVAIILGSFIIYKLYEKKEEEKTIKEEKPIPKNEINEYARLYEDKIAVSLRLEKLEKDVLKKKVKMVEYRKQKRVYLENIEKLEKEIIPLREKLIKMGTRYANAVKDLEILDAEKENALKSLEDLKIRYRRRKISTETYLKLKEDFERKITKTTQTIDKIILTLKQEAM